MPVARALAVVLVAATCGAAVAAGPPRLRRPPRGARIVAGPVAVPRGGEVTECTYLKLPSRRDLAVNRIRIKVRGGSHHIHLYRPRDPGAAVPDGHETCDFALDFDLWQLVLASQSARLDWRLPPGVAFRFRAREQLVAQTHFVDVGQLETAGDGWAAIALHGIPERKVRSFAGAIFGQDRDVVVPPRSTATATTRCRFPRPVRLLAITGHYHFRGVRFTASSWDGSDGDELYRHDGYDEPAFVRFGDPAPEVQGVAWTCEYDNPTDEAYAFGPFTDENEHCNLFAWYHPTLGEEEFTTCVRERGVTTVAVGPPGPPGP